MPTRSTVSPTLNVHLRGLPPELHERLKAAAEENRRSLNGEILARLEDSFAPGPTDPAELLDRIRSRASRPGIPSLSASELRRRKESGRA